MSYDPYFEPEKRAFAEPAPTSADAFAASQALPPGGTRENPWANTEGSVTALQQPPNAPGVQSFGDWMRAKDEQKSPVQESNAPGWLQDYLASADFKSLQSPKPQPQESEPAIPKVSPSEYQGKDVWMTESDPAKAHAILSGEQKETSFWDSLAQNWGQQQQQQTTPQQPTRRAPAAAPAMPQQQAPTPISYSQTATGSVLVTMSDGSVHELAPRDPSVVRMMATTPEVRQ